MKNKAFNNPGHNKLRLTFPNGNELSTVWGYCTYSDNNDMDYIENPIEKFDTFASSNTVEIMILEAPTKLINKIHKKLKSEGDSVIGYLTIEQWLWVVKELSK